MKHQRILTLLLIIRVASLPVAVQGHTVQRFPNQASRINYIVARLRARLNGSMAAGRFPGAQVGFVFFDGQGPDGKPQYVSGSIAVGVSDLQSKTLLKTTDRLMAGSIGKTFVAALTLLLVQDGKLTLDDKVERWLGKEPWFRQLPNAQAITLRMLLNHSTGIENHAQSNSFQKQLLKSAGRNIKYEELISYVLNKKPLFPAGQGYNYADSNYILLGMIIEKATQRSLYDLIDERILKPNNLVRTIPSNSLALPEVANGYFVDGKPVIVDGKFTVNPQWEWAGGGFASTAEDLARWASKLYSGEVLSASSMDSMINSTSTGEGAVYGLGMMIFRSNWGRTFGHDGEFPGYVSDLRYYTRYKIAVAVMVNSDETPGVSRFIATAADDVAETIIKATAAKDLSEADQSKLKSLSEGWLSLLQQDNLDQAWNQVSDRLTARFTKEMWIALMHRFLDRSGKIKTRKLRTINYINPENQSVTILYDSVFEKLPTATETLILERQGGEWKISSYSIR